LIPKISDYGRPVEDVSGITDVANVSAGNDSDVGELIGRAYSKIGREGFLFLEEGKATGNELVITEGLGFEQGYISSYFVTDKEKMEVVLEKPFILLTDKKISSVKQHLLPTLELISKTGRPLLIVSDNVEKEALATLIINKVKGILKVAAVRAMGFGERRKALLKDLSIVTGGHIINADSGLTLESMELELLGQARRVVIGKDSTKIISDANKRQVLARFEQLRRKLETSDSSYDKETLNERLSKLSGGVALIRVGGATVPEMKDRKLRLEDAISATKSAIEEGVVPGGGTLLAYLSDYLLEWAKKNVVGEELIGALIVEKALRMPVKKIASNAGQNGPVILERVKNAGFEIGYDVAKNDLVNMFETGIVDPVRVTRSTLQNAASIASMVLTTECIIVDK
jgi:chaperonin GroEL